MLFDPVYVTAQAESFPRQNLRVGEIKMTTTAEIASPASSTKVAAAGKYLTFLLGHESYGIRVIQVREIIRLSNITAVPQLPPHVRGVINLRGRVIPVMDLRLKLGMPGAEGTDQTCIVVVHVKLADGRNAAMGLVVDGVEEVANIASADIEETPSFGADLSTPCILGMAKIKGEVKILVEIDRLVSGDAAEFAARTVANTETHS
jgi:purine-binding chemotaxis protein CheW